MPLGVDFRNFWRLGELHASQETVETENCCRVNVSQVHVLNLGAFSKMTVLEAGFWGDDLVMKVESWRMGLAFYRKKHKRACFLFAFLPCEDVARRYGLQTRK